MHCRTHILYHSVLNECPTNRQPARILPDDNKTAAAVTAPLANSNPAQSADRVFPSQCNHACSPWWVARRALGSTKRRDRPLFVSLSRRSS